MSDCNDSQFIIKCSKCLNEFKPNSDNVYYLSSLFDGISIEIECPKCEYSEWIK